MTEQEPFPTSESLEIPIRLDQQPQSGKPHTRARSNSKVYGQANPLLSRTSSHSNGNKNRSDNDLPNGSTRNVLQRDFFAHLVILASLNETFDKKTLAIPTHPQVLKLGRPNSSQKAPSSYNGYFDSRVISREHAELFFSDGVVYLRDCNSSNGTFVNGAKIKEQKALQVGDTVDLGVDIDTEKTKHQHHRKISCKVENILTIPLDGVTDMEKVLEELATTNGMTNGERSKIDNEEGITMNPFDAAMFGDVTRDLEDLTLGTNHDFLSGIFVNNDIGTSPSLVHSIRLLIKQLHQEKLNNMKLDSVVTVLEKYKSEIDKPGENSASKLKEFKLQIDDYKLRNDKYKTQIIELEGKLQRNMERLSVSQEEVHELTKRQETLFNTVTDEHKLNEDYVRTISEMEVELKTKMSEIEILNKEIQFSESDRDEKDSRIVELKSALSEKNDEITLLRKENLELIEKSLKLDSVRTDMMLLGVVMSAVIVVGALVLR